MSQHAPGPWVNEAGTIIASDDTVVCEVYGGDGRRFIDDEDNAICLANNKLIVTAPELLEALELMMTFKTLISENHPDAVYTLEKAHAAIHKAKGDSP